VGAPRLAAPILALGLAIALTWGVGVGLVRAGRNPILTHGGAFAVAFVLYVIAGALVLRHAPEGAGGGPSRRHLLVLILGLALLPRAILLASQPALSDDLYRYIWDGRVIAAGIDPYRYAPAAPELAALRDPLWERINYKAAHTPYPPAAQLVFALTYRIAPDSVKAQQVVATAADLLAIGVLLGLLGRLGLARERVLLYAWSPLPALQFAHSAHNDALMVAALLLALALATGNARGRAGSGLALAFAALVKLAPLLLAPLLLRRWRAAGTLACALGLALGGARYLRFGPAGLMGLGEARANDSLHNVLVHFLAPITTPASVAVGAASGVLIAATLVGTALALAWRDGRTGEDLTRGAAFLLGLSLLLSPIQPWYLTWMLPFIALFLRPGSGRWPFAPTPLLGWLWLSGAIQLTELIVELTNDAYLGPHYLGPQATGWWPLLIRAVEYGPLLALFAWAAVTRPRPLIRWDPARAARRRGK
jgi:hypothetical protein